MHIALVKLFPETDFFKLSPLNGDVLRSPDFNELDGF